MPESPKALGFAGRWYTEAVRSASWHVLSTGTSVRIPCPTRLLACKLQAYIDRGVHGEAHAASRVRAVVLICFDRDPGHRAPVSRGNRYDQLVTPCLANRLGRGHEGEAQGKTIIDEDGHAMSLGWPRPLPSLPPVRIPRCPGALQAYLSGPRRLELDRKRRARSSRAHFAERVVPWLSCHPLGYSYTLGMRA